MEAEQKSYHILRLEASNIKGIKAVIIEPKPGVALIEGKNGQGKTSALDAIERALRGGKLSPNKPIREGEEKGEITIELGDHLAGKVDFTVRRTFTDKGSYLKVVNPDGFEIKQAQSMLDQLCGAMAFDPMEFTRMPAKQRSETLKQIAGLDFSEIESNYNKTFTERTVLNRQVKELEAQLKDYADVQPVEIPDISEIQAKKKEAEENNSNIRDLKSTIARQEQSLESLVNERNAVLEEIKKLEKKLEENDLRIYKANTTIKGNEEKLKTMSIVDTSDFDNQIAEYGTLVNKAQVYDRKVQIEKEYSKKKGNAEQMTSNLEGLLKEKEKQLEEANLPVPGLDFKNGDVSFNGIEFEQINTAEKIKISMCMAMALNPRLKVVRIMNGSLIDSDGMDEIKKIAQEKGFDIWIEKVSNRKTSENSFLISEGELHE